MLNKKHRCSLVRKFPEEIKNVYSIITAKATKRFIKDEELVLLSFTDKFC